MSAGRNKRLAALRGEAAQREALRQAYKKSGRSPFELTKEEDAQIFDVRPLGRDPEVIRKLGNVCLRCGVEGHHVDSCPTLVCDACGGLGHKAKRCTKAKT